MKITNPVMAATVVSLLMVPSAVLAGFPVPSTYAAFVPSAVQLSLRADELATTCLASALRTPDNLALQVACNDAQTARLDERIRVDIRIQMPRRRSPEVTRFNSSQKDWKVARTLVCNAMWNAELNPSSNSFALAVSKCVVDETYRRALWIESVVQ